MELKNPLNCCGVWELHGFLGGVKEVRPKVASLLRNVQATARAGFKGAEGCGIIVATLTNSQLPHYKDLLEDFAFKKVTDFDNPRSTAHLTMFLADGKAAYAKALKEPETKAPPVKHTLMERYDSWCGPCGRYYDSDGISEGSYFHFKP